jgi:hypothetical protein
MFVDISAASSPMTPATMCLGRLQPAYLRSSTHVTATGTDAHMVHACGRPTHLRAASSDSSSPFCARRLPPSMLLLASWLLSSARREVRVASDAWLRSSADCRADTWVCVCGGGGGTGGHNRQQQYDKQELPWFCYAIVLIMAATRGEVEGRPAAWLRSSADCRADTRGGGGAHVSTSTNRTSLWMEGQPHALGPSSSFPPVCAPKSPKRMLQENPVAQHDHSAEVHAWFHTGPG